MCFPEKGIYFLFDPVKWNKQPWEKGLKNILPDISALQLRSSSLSDNEFYQIALKLKLLLKSYDIPLIIDNRMDVAIAVDSHAIHLGSEDLPIQAAKKHFKGIIGASRHTPQGARQAQEEGADYIGCGPVFKTSTKELKRAVIGPEGFLKVKSSVKIPVIPIGGIGLKNISRLKDITEIVAVASGINDSKIPELAVRSIKSGLGI